MATFLSLPGEIRNAIYDMVLFPRHTYIPINATGPKDLIRTVFKSPLHRTCRTIRAELLGRLCKTKTLSFTSYKALKVLANYMSWIGNKSIISSNLKTIAIQIHRMDMGDFKKATYYLHGMTARDVREPFAKLEALETLELTTFMDTAQPFVVLKRQEDGTFAQDSEANMDYPPKAAFKGVLKGRNA